MTKFVQPPTGIRWIIVFVAILSLSTLVMAQQDTLDDTKDVIIDEPADKIEDVFDEPADKVEDVFDDDDNDYDADHDRQKSSCAVDKDDDCDADLDDEDCGVDLDYSACEVEEDKCDLDVDDDDCEVEEDKCDLDVDDDDCEVEEDKCDLDVDDDACEVEEPEMTICEQTTSVAPDTSPMVISLDELQDNADSYYGKTVTVVGELHRIFTDKVFTIEDDGFWRDKDSLVINQGSGCVDIEACNDEFEPGKDLRVTGLVVPYNRGKLECEHGPLNLESREGHSFTKNPVLIVGRIETAAVIEIEREKPAVVEPTPEPPPPPAPEPVFEPTPPPAPEPLPELPRTASESPLLGLIGVLSLCAAFVLRRSAAERSR